MPKEKQQTFLGATATLGAAVILVKLIGAIYKIPLGNIIGRDGMTHFNAAYKIYAVLLSLSTAGLPVALSKLVAESRALGLCGYLGERRGDGGELREVYGRRLEGVITVEIRGARAADCEKGAETAAAVLLGKLPPGIRPGELRWEGLAWEKRTGLFLRRGSLRCDALFLAERGDQGPEFLDFTLKGVLGSEQSP